MVCKLIRISLGARTARPHAAQRAAGFGGQVARAPGILASK